MANKQKRSGMLIAAMLIALTVATATGCAKMEKALSDAEQGKSTITKEDGSQVVISGNSDIPDLFPSDVPMPDEIHVVSSISSDNGVTVAFETELSFDKVFNMYFDYAQKNGYTEVHKLDGEGFISYSGQKGTERFIFNLQLNLEDNKTLNGSIIYSNKKEANE